MKCMLVIAFRNVLCTNYIAMWSNVTKKIGFDRCLNIVTSEKGCNCGQNVGCLRCSKIVTLGIMVSEMRQREVLLNDSVELVSHTLTAKNI